MMAMAKMTLTSIPFSGLAALTRTQAPVSSLVMFKHLFTLIRAMAGLMMMKLLRKLENGHEEEEGVKIGKGDNFIYRVFFSLVPPLKVPSTKKLI